MKISEPMLREYTAELLEACGTNGCIFPYSASGLEIRGMIRAALKAIWAGAPHIPEKELRKVTLTQTPIEQWWARK